jgi:biopolymer transport protein ExbD
MAASTENQDEVISNINITPMVDIMLVLLVIFMVTANFLKDEAVKVNLPRVAQSDPNLRKSTQITLTKDGKIYLENTESDTVKIIKTLEREVKIRPNMRVTLAADENLPYGQIAKIIGLIRKSGINRIALSVKK